MVIHFHKLVIKTVTWETADTILVSFDVPEPLKTVFSFLPGQNITIRSVIDGNELRRSYSVCSDPGDELLSIAIREVRDGLFSSWAIRTLIEGHQLEVLPPTGSFIVQTNADHRKNYLAIAAGSGITPVYAIIASVLFTEPNSRFVLLYGNRTQQDIIFREKLAGLKNRYMDRFVVHHFLSRETTDAEIYNGRLDSDKLNRINGKLIWPVLADEVFICGPAEMISGTKGWMLDHGVAEQKIHTELFSVPDATGKTPVKNPIPGSTNGDSRNVEKSNTTGSEKNDTNNSPRDCQVTVKADGHHYVFKLAMDGEKILNAALEHGADLPFSCKGGVCGTCRAKILQGTVDMELNYALEPDELAAGYILTCQSHPTSEIVVIDFDS